MRDTSETTLYGVRLTHPDRVLYPELGLTKRELVKYYARLADHLLPEVVGRPLSVVRCPEGRGGECFYQKHTTRDMPEYIGRVPIQEDAAVADYLEVHDRTGLLWLVQMGTLEIHPWGAHSADVEHPDRMIFDADPAPGVAWGEVERCALRLRELLVEVGLTSFVKTTGGKGLHVVVPLAPGPSWDQVKDFAHAVALRLEKEEPARYLANMSKTKRAGRIFVDYLRNARGATAVAAYSTRARSGAPVSTPLFWEELGSGLHPEQLNVATVPDRLAAQEQDPWAAMRKLRQRLPEAFS
ncbi:MAG TPA: non-homologous end-joining DNA ligase [Armatimonadota bacterium]|jgi:bifunctional non-homologous end joining protein LigD